MGSIHYGVHITLGVIVLVVSLVQQEMRIFAVAGIGFIIWGLIRLAIVKSEEKKNTRKHTAHNKVHHTHQQTHHHNQIHQHGHHPQKTQTPYHSQHATHHQTHHSKYKVCPNCQAVIEKTYRFCPYCGYGV